MALHETSEVFALSMASLPCEEYFPCEAELALLEKQEPALFKTYRELMCHFYICLDVHEDFKGNSNNLKSWAYYLFLTLEKAPKEARFRVVEEDILWMMKKHDHEDILLEEDDGIHEKGDTFKSFHHQACQLISQKALLAGFLSVWLKRCVMPSPPHDAILLTALLLVIRLVHGRSLGLLLAMVCCTQHGLRALTEAFRGPPVMKRRKGIVLPRDGTNFTYMMAWFALHCPVIINPGKNLQGCSDHASLPI